MKLQKNDEKLRKYLILSNRQWEAGYTALERGAWPWCLTMISIKKKKKKCHKMIVLGK